MGLGKRKRSASKKREEAAAQAFAQYLAGIVEAGFLMAASDGNLDDSELDLLAGVIIGISDGYATEEQIDELLGACYDALERDGYEARLQACSDNLQTDEARKLALEVAAHVLFADDEFDPDNEGDIYVNMAGTFGVGRRDAIAILEAVEEEYS